MMIGIVGTLSDLTEGQIIRGNGKTATMTYLLKNLYADEGYKVYTNYQTTFSTVYQTEDIENVLNQISRGEKKGYAIGIDEIQIFTNSYDRISKKDISFIILKLIQQSRHKNLDVFYTSQRFKDVHRRIRVQTDDYIIPKKYHLDGKRCSLDRCYKDHIIIVKDFYERYNPFYFNIKEISELYDTGEIIE
jgi:hypothetical protein